METHGPRLRGSVAEEQLPEALERRFASDELWDDSRQDADSALGGLRASEALEDLSNVRARRWFAAQQAQDQLVDLRIDVDAAPPQLRARGTAEQIDARSHFAADALVQRHPERVPVRRG
jgi:hypothetical protein